MKKQKFIDGLKEGEKIQDVFLVKSSKLAETRAGKPYLVLELKDKSGEISGPIWENATRFAPMCEAGSFLLVRAMVQSYRDNLQLRIEEIRPVEKEQISLADFVQASLFNLEEMAKEVQAVVASVENVWIRKLLQRFFKAGESWEKFKQAPAAKGLHHAYVGGLMEHCLSMAKIGSMMAAHYPGIDRSILLAGVFLHDIGKLWELDEEVGVVDYTVPGRLKGHLVMGSEAVGREASKIKDFPEELLVQIQHLILSHHGRYEFGSPTLPMTPEAFLLSYIDDLDSKMNLIEHLRYKVKNEEGEWSDYQRSLERFLYLSSLQKGDLQENNDAHDTKSPEQLKRQATLF